MNDDKHYTRFDVRLDIKGYPPVFVLVVEDLHSGDATPPLEVWGVTQGDIDDLASDISELVVVDEVLEQPGEDG